MDSTVNSWSVFQNTPLFIDARHNKSANIVMGDGHVETVSGYNPPIALAWGYRTANWWPSGKYNVY